MPGTPTWKGSRDIHEQPGSPRTVLTASGARVTRIFRGPYGSLMAGRPNIGAEMEGTPGVYVESVDVVPEKAGPLGPGVMTVIATNESTGGSVTDPEDFQAIYEMEWGLLMKPIEQHPRYAALTTTDLAALEAWKQEQDIEVKAAYQYTFRNINGTLVSQGLSALAQDLASKLFRGILDYQIPSPIARQTTRTYTKPATSTQGKREAPPAGCSAPTGYEFIKTADRAMRQGRGGKWERIEEWTGSDSWDHDLYPSS